MLRTPDVLTGLLLLLIPGPLMAHPGLIEINQAVIDAAGGFPYALTGPGSYVLTGPLTVPASTDGLRLGNEVVLDLNGFSITGPATCTASSCPFGTGDGVRPDHPVLDGNRTSVRNGIIRGFAGNCLSLASEAHVEDVTVSRCGGFGIGVGLHSLVQNNRVLWTGRRGINMTSGVVFAHNTVSLSGRGGGGEAAVAGGVASAGNYCDDGTCRDTLRRYYVTHAFFDGDDAGKPGSCALGFHFASLYEIANPASLRYDHHLGQPAFDGGAGPPPTNGWVRTGFVDPDTRPGIASCRGWTSADVAQRGTVAALTTGAGNWTSPATVVSPWYTDVSPCSALRNLWCVED